MSHSVVLSYVSGVVLLGVSSVLGFMGYPAEMGFSVVAGAIGLAFANIERIKRFKGAGFEAEMFEAVVEREIEPDPVGIPPKDLGLIDAGKRAVLSALDHSKYTWRTLVGVVTDTGLDRKVVLSALKELEQLGLVRSSVGRRGSIWSLTIRGRDTQVAINRDMAESA